MYSRGCSKITDFFAGGFTGSLYIREHCCKVSAKNNDRYPPENASDNDVFSTPRKSLPTPSKSTAALTTLRSMPTPLVNEHRYVCSSCKKIEDCGDFLLKSTVSDLSLNSNYISTYKSVERIGHMISEFELKIEYISKQMNNIEKSISDHITLINNLERDICRFADIHFNYQSNPNPVLSATQTSPVSGLHTRESSRNLVYPARSRSAEAQPSDVSPSNRRQPCYTPSVKIRPSLSASETRNAVVRTKRVTSQLVCLLLLVPKLNQTQFLFWGTATRDTSDWVVPT